MLSTEQRNCSSKPSDTQTEADSKESGSKDLLTVAGAAAVFGIKEATVRSVDTQTEDHVCKAGQGRPDPSERTQTVNPSRNCSVGLSGALEMKCR